ncbi:sensor domain-containing diguanylate cyclase [Deinococcus radiotolerans]|uniref:Diguanylate cyclase n=1 Tax=Deinococcus radiotolerans TaxID=1309407 RepID=A0ABQ2FMZ4_9DEIO|nr:sensor domain-containing diguanylate cyclase [Deinococcus radiotolerans]GGL08159.1 diguanylate cyclase [Deinococcus radiotolerans]
MSLTPPAQDEAARLRELARYQVLDTDREESFDRFTRLAARLLRTPVALINFVDEHRQWSKSMVGPGVSEVPRSQSFCAWTIQGDAPFVVEAAPTDPRFAANPLVLGAPHVHMYAGAPLITPSGYRIGALCVTDSRAHPLSSEDLHALQDLAALVMQELEARRERLDAAFTGGAPLEDLPQTLAHLRVVEGIGRLLDVDLPFDDLLEACAALVSEAVEADFTAVLVPHGEGLAVRVPQTAHLFSSEVEEAAATLLSGSAGVLGSVGQRAEPLYLEAYADQPRAVPALVAAGVQQVAYIPLGDGAQRPLLLVMRLAGNPVTTWRAPDRALLEVTARTIGHALRRQSALNRAHAQAREDGLTGVLNRRAFSEDVLEAAHHGPGVHLAVIDLDGLKSVNDHEGHAQGDRLLQVFAQALHAEVASRGQVYRLGGDEFAVLSGVSVDALLACVQVAAHAARRAVQSAVSASVGVASWAEAGSADALLRLADTRMYDMKRLRNPPS